MRGPLIPWILASFAAVIAGRAVHGAPLVLAPLLPSLLMGLMATSLLGALHLLGDGRVRRPRHLGTPHRRNRRPHAAVLHR